MITRLIPLQVDYSDGRSAKGHGHDGSGKDSGANSGPGPGRDSGHDSHGGQGQR